MTTLRSGAREARKRRLQLAGSDRGFSMVELMIAIAVVATASLMLVAALGSQQKMNALARERSLATNAIRAYVEAMRQKYPAQNQTDMSGFLNDTSTPADYLPSLGVEASAMRDARGLVLKMSDETGYSWGMAAGAATWGFTETSMKTVGTLSTGTYTAHTTTGYAFAGSTLPIANGTAYHPTLADLDSMGFISLTTASTVCCKDLDGSGTIANTDAANVYANTQILVPCQITLSWKSGSGGETNSSNVGATRQRITMYAAFGPTH